MMRDEEFNTIDLPLHGSDLLNALDEPVRQELVRQAYLVDFNPGDTIFRAGSAGRSMMAIASGAVRISILTRSGREVILADLSPGEVFGEVALLDGGERSAEARALLHCRVVVLERRVVLDLLERHPKAALQLLKLVCGRLRRSDERMAELAFLGLPERLAKAVLRATARVGEERGVTLALSQTELANMSGSSRENVNRCLRRWHQQGLIEIRDGYVGVVDRLALERIADDA